MNDRPVSHVLLEPFPGERVIVFCKGFRCLGYQDSSHHWYNAFKESQLADVVRWVRSDWIEATLDELKR